MIAVIQRVKQGSVRVEGRVIGQINRGMVVLVGIGKEDGEKEIDFLTDKLLSLRIFESEKGEFDRSIMDIQGEILVVSQFTLLGNCRKGRRPSFDQAAPPQTAKRIYDDFVGKLKQAGLKIETGQFQASMLVTIENDGPVTLILQSP